MRTIATLFFFVLLCTSFPVYAAQLSSSLVESFAPLKGSVIMPVGKEYLVDLDASSGLRNGDILSLVQPGDAIEHPTTGERLGNLDRVIGFLQVSRVKSGYSYAQPLTAATQPQKGDRVIRFEQVPAYFTGPDSGNLEGALKLKLSHLQWLETGHQDRAELIFTITDQNLTVTDSSGTVLRTYVKRQSVWVNADIAASGDPFQFGPAAEKGRSVLNQTVGKIMNTVGLGDNDKRLQNPAILRSQSQNKNVWFSANLGGNPVGLAVADFDQDGRQEVAIALDDRLKILRYDGELLKPVAEIAFSEASKVLALDSFDVNHNGRPELLISARTGTQLSSMIIGYDQGTYQNILSRLPYLFRVVDLLPASQVLLGQTLRTEGNPQAENSLAQRAYRLTLEGDELQKGQQLALPAEASLFSLARFSGPSDAPLTAYISDGDRLYLNTPQGSTLWESPEAFGGTETLFYTQENTGEELVQPIYIQQRLRILPTGEILTAQNEGPRLLQRYRNFNKSRMVALRWDGMTMQEAWKTADQDGYLADFAWADIDHDGQPELVTAVKYREKNLLQDGRSNLVVYEISE